MLSSRAAMVGKDNPLPTPSAISFVNAAEGPPVSGFGTISTSWNHTIVEGTNCLLVGAFHNDLTNGPTPVLIDSGGPFRVLDHVQYNAFGVIHFTLYGLFNPPVGTRTISTTSFGYNMKGNSIAYSGVSGFAATIATVVGSVSSLSFGLPAFPGGVAVAYISGGWSSLTQTSRSTTSGWQESTVNTGIVQNFSTNWAGGGDRFAVAAVLK